MIGIFKTKIKTKLKYVSKVSEMSRGNQFVEIKGLI